MKSESDDPNVITEETIAANGQAVDIKLIKKYDGTPIFKIDKDGYVSEPQGTTGLGASYIIFKSGSVYYAKNGSTGAIAYSGLDAATVINAAITATTFGEIVLRDAVALAASVNMKSNVAIRNQSKVSVATDITAFAFNATTGAKLIGGEIEYTGTPTLPAITFVGACVKNRLCDLYIDLPVGFGYGIQCTANNAGAYSNDFSDIFVNYGKQAMRIITAGNGWWNCNRFDNITSWIPSEHAFHFESTGNEYSGFGGNTLTGVWAELNHVAGLHAFYITGTGTGVFSNNYLFGCSGVDMAVGTGYAFYIEPTTTNTVRWNSFVGCQGLAWITDATELFLQNLWIDKNHLEVNPYIVALHRYIEYHYVTPHTDVDLIFRLSANKATAGRTGYFADMKNTVSSIFIGAYSNEYRVQAFKDVGGGGALFPIKFCTLVDTTKVEAARLDTDSNFKFYQMVLPLAAPTTPVAGSLYYSVATKQLLMYTGAAWISVLANSGENSGLSVGTGTQQTIAHGLIGTPNRVIVWPIDMGSLPYQSAVADATNIYLTGVSGKNYGWEAKIV